MAGFHSEQANPPTHKSCHNMFFFVFQWLAMNDRLRSAFVLSPAGDSKVRSTSRSL